MILRQPADTQILQCLRCVARGTPKNIAAYIDPTPEYTSNRLSHLADYGLVNKLEMPEYELSEYGFNYLEHDPDETVEVEIYTRISERLNYEVEWRYTVSPEATFE